MQGLGKPGQHSFSIINRSVFGSEDHPAFPPSPGSIINNPGPSVRGAYQGYSPFPFVELPRQIIPKTMVHDAILKGHFTISGSSLQSTPAAEQFVEYHYPAEGCSPIHMIWTDTPCLITCWNDGNRNVEAYRHPSIEFFLAQHPWMENDCLFADLVLPVNTKFEEDDIGDDCESVTFEMVYLENRCIEPLGESKSDYEIVCMVAERLGLLEEYTEGRTIAEWIRHGFDTSGVPAAGLIGWEEFSENQYYVVPSDPDWEQHPAGMYEFYVDPENNPLSTPSGKLEFESLDLRQALPGGRREAAGPALGGVRRVPRRTSLQRRGRVSIRCSACPTTPGTGCTRSSTTTAGTARWRPARSRVRTATCTSRCGSIPPRPPRAASGTGTSAGCSTSEGRSLSEPA